MIVLKYWSSATLFGSGCGFLLGSGGHSALSQWTDAACYCVLGVICLLSSVTVACSRRRSVEK